MKEERASGKSQASRNRRGVLVVSIDRTDRPLAREFLSVISSPAGMDGRSSACVKSCGCSDLRASGAPLIWNWYAVARRLRCGLSSASDPWRSCSRREQASPHGCRRDLSIDPILRRNLEQLPHDDPAFALVGDHPSSVPELLNQYRIDVLLADAPTRELLANIEAGTIG